MAAPLFAPRQPREKPSGLALRQGSGQTVPLARSEVPAAEPFAGLYGTRPGGTRPSGLPLSPFPAAEPGRRLGAASLSTPDEGEGGHRARPLPAC